MDRLLEYSSHHLWLVLYAALTAAAVLFYELRQQAHNAGALAPQDVIRLMNQGATLLDLRAQPAYAQGHIAGARQFEPAQIETAGDTLKKYKERPLVIYADQGSVGAAAVKSLARQGFTKVFALRGGLAAWRAENLPLARD